MISINVGDFTIRKQYIDCEEDGCYNGHTFHQMA